MTRRSMPSTRSKWILAAALLLAACGGGVVAPVLGARYSATLPVSVAQASRAVLSFDVSEDGSRIDYVLLDIEDLECAAISAERSSYMSLVMAPITSGKFSFESAGVGSVTGAFVSSDKAEGTVTINYQWEDGGALTNFWVHDPEGWCDLGTFAWEATAGEHGPYPTPPSSPAPHVEQPPSG
jgi:hypothetical protein